MCWLVQLPASGTVPVTVVTGCGTANEVAPAAFNVPVAASRPSFSTSSRMPTANRAAIRPPWSSTGAYVGPPGLISGATFAPAHAGDVLTAFGVGWGPTTSSDPIGTIASAARKLTSTYTLTLGGMPVATYYMRDYRPRIAGLYQINFTVPAGVSPGNQPLVLTVNGRHPLRIALLP